MVKFEEVEMPSLDHIMASSDGIYHCPYQDCKLTTTFRQRHLLKKHTRQHVRPVKCPVNSCLHRAAGQVDIRRHVESFHKSWAEENLGVVTEFACKRCGSLFTRKDNLMKHERNAICR
ncbi:hypothetical protein BJY01DRAFT_214471 [Aspergillus pseudoustus]|uniref:C2H2-type domain-containing protein n=1 Tax=Aspergillus pseudoustus TaxID=1810923 RepID=A0ABR4JYA7_9EURO